MVGTKQTQRKGTGASEGADASKDAPKPPQEVEVVELLDSSSDDDSSDECVIVDPPPKPAAKRRRTEGAGAGAGAGAAQQGTPTRKRGTRLGGYLPGVARTPGACGPLSHTQRGTLVRMSRAW